MNRPKLNNEREFFREEHYLLEHLPQEQRRIYLSLKEYAQQQVEEKTRELKALLESARRDADNYQSQRDKANVQLTESKEELELAYEQARNVCLHFGTDISDGEGASFLEVEKIVEFGVNELQSELTTLREVAKELDKGLKMVVDRLQICFYRISACNQETKRHGVSIGEIPAWVAEHKEALARYSEITGGK